MNFNTRTLAERVRPFLLWR